MFSECTGVTSVSAGPTFRFLKLLIISHGTLVYVNIGKHVVTERE